MDDNRQAAGLAAEGAEPTAAAQAVRGPSYKAVLRERNFRLLWLGEGISLLGDQFHMIALPWLVLQLTGDGLAVGTVLAVAGIPRALFMPLGGALADRLSARNLMLASNLARLVLVALLAALVLTGAIQVWMLYAFALLFGLASAFFFPAQSAIVPQLVKTEDLQAGNSLIQGTAQRSVLLGPALAGSLIAVLDGAGGRTAADAVGLWGIGVAFAIDAATFLVSAGTLWLMRLSRAKARAITPGEGDLLSSVREGLRTVWGDEALRMFFLVIAGINLLFVGPFMVGVPVLADSRFAEGAVAFGMIVSAYGAGSLGGTLLAGVLPRPSPQHFARRLLLVTSVLGLGLVVLGLASSTLVAAAVGLVMGVSDGYVVILFITWLQVRTPPAMLGRTMSLLMFAGMGLSPLSLALAGVSDQPERHGRLPCRGWRARPAGRARRDKPARAIAPVGKPARARHALRLNGRRRDGLEPILKERAASNNEAALNRTCAIPVAGSLHAQRLTGLGRPLRVLPLGAAHADEVDQSLAYHAVGVVRVAHVADADHRRPRGAFDPVGQGHEVALLLEHVDPAAAQAARDVEQIDTGLAQPGSDALRLLRRDPALDQVVGAEAVEEREARAQAHAYLGDDLERQAKAPFHITPVLVFAMVGVWGCELGKQVAVGAVDLDRVETRFGRAAGRLPK